MTAPPRPTSLPRPLGPRRVKAGEIAFLRVEVWGAVAKGADGRDTAVRIVDRSGNVVDPGPYFVAESHLVTMHEARKAVSP